MNELSIYIHIPFCRSKCGYCDFLSFEGCQGHIDDYVDALCRDIVHSADNFKGYGVATVFFGGGTPSLLNLEHLSKILWFLRTHFDLTISPKRSIECNPDTTDAAYLAGLQGLGFERVSFGVQSFDDAHLASLGRTHNSQTAVDAVKAAHEAGFGDVNIDLMFALPNQTIDDFGRCLDMAISLPITHISCYALTMDGYEANEDTDRTMYALAKEKLKNAGFHHYEISNWSKVGYNCQHNMGYWTGREYLGLGLGASSYFKNGRFVKTENLNDYINGDHKFILQEKLSIEAKMSEFMMLGLRLIKGISISQFMHKFGRSPFEVFGDFVDGELIKWHGDKISLTARGLDLSNVAFQKFLLD